MKVRSVSVYLSWLRSSRNRDELQTKRHKEKKTHFLSSILLFHCFTTVNLGNFQQQIIPKQKDPRGLRVALHNKC